MHNSWLPLLSTFNRMSLSAPQRISTSLLGRWQKDSVLSDLIVCREISLCFQIILAFHTLTQFSHPSYSQRSFLTNTFEGVPGRSRRDGNGGLRRGRDGPDERPGARHSQRGEIPDRGSPIGRFGLVQSDDQQLYYRRAG